MNNVVTAADPNSIAEPSPELGRAIALLSEGLLEAHEFFAITGIEAAMVPTLLQSANMLTAVQRASIQLRNSGALARLEAARHAREAVQIAAQIMQDSESHASNRLSAATFIAKIAGTERAPSPEQRQEPFTVRIILGEKPPVVIERKPPIGGPA